MKDDFVEFILSLTKPSPEFTIILLGKVADVMKEKLQNSRWPLMLTYNFESFSIRKL